MLDLGGGAGAASQASQQQREMEWKVRRGKKRREIESHGGGRR